MKRAPGPGRGRVLVFLSDTAELPWGGPLGLCASLPAYLKAFGARDPERSAADSTLIATSQKLKARKAKQTSGPQTRQIAPARLPSQAHADHGLTRLARGCASAKAWALASPQEHYMVLIVPYI